jgi:ketosteroid isomerase-like protein
MSFRPIALGSVGFGWMRREHGITERAALLEQFTAAWEAHDLDALMALMTDDCRFRASVGPEPGSTFDGPDEVRHGFALFLGRARVLDPEPAETVTEPPLISDEFAVTRWTTRVRHSIGPPFVVSACDIFTFAGAQIASKDTYRKVSGNPPAAA